jgi:molybdate transport system substrate-binding protein
LAAVGRPAAGPLAARAAPRLAGLAAAAALASAGLGCGKDETGARPAAPEGPARVFVAASLRDVVADIAPGAELSAGGTDRLSRQIRAGAPADVLVAAAPREPRALRAAGLCGPPTPVATNRLVLLVGPGSPVDGLGDLLTGPRRRLAVGAPGVPVGAYTRELLRRAAASAALERNRVSLEPSVSGIVSKVALGSADAGIAYATDARAAAGRVRAVPLPADAQPAITAVACVVSRAQTRWTAAAGVIEALTSPLGQRRLRAAGFRPLPST